MIFLEWALYKCYLFFTQIIIKIGIKVIFNLLYMNNGTCKKCKKRGKGSMIQIVVYTVRTRSRFHPCDPHFGLIIVNADRD